MNELSMPQREGPRICVIGAGPCGLATLKNLLAVGLSNVVCYEERDAIGGNWVFREDANEISVYECTHIISSRRLSEFEDYPMPAHYPDFPSHPLIRAYFEDYARDFRLWPFIRLSTRVDDAVRRANGRWMVRSSTATETREEPFDYLFVCSGHHRTPFVPDRPGHFTGQALHSSAFKRAAPFAGKRVLVVGGGNSACDIAVEMSRVAARTCVSLRRAYYILPNRVLGLPIDAFYAWTRLLPRPLLRVLGRPTARLFVGSWKRYGLAPPRCHPLEMHPTLNSNMLGALAARRVSPRPDIRRLDGDIVEFCDGTREAFDTLVWATGFRTSFPFLGPAVVDWDPECRPPLYLKMMHRRFANLFFIGLFQPIGCIWRLADHQAHIAALQIAGALPRPRDIALRIDREQHHPHWAFDTAPRHALEVDYHDFRRELLAHLNERTSEPGGVCAPLSQAG
jgi:cation diffusion facilitator CzcD-associated flavoprotein CzcO